jgi:hypothetical protein
MPDHLVPCTALELDVSSESDQSVWVVPAACSIGVLARCETRVASSPVFVQPASGPYNPCASKARRGHAINLLKCGDFPGMIQLNE